MEKIGLTIEFIERIQNYQGLNDISKKCIVKVTDHGFQSTQPVELSEEWSYKSWDDMLKEYPTFKDLLKSLFKLDYWTVKAYSSDFERVLYAKEIIGYKGLYEDIDSIASSNEVKN